MDTVPIPGPTPLPILGNVLDLPDLKNIVQSFNDLADKYGPIYKLRLIGAGERIFLSDYDLVDEICSRKDFAKAQIGIVSQLKKVTPEGLFTADNGEEFWELAHRVLMPAFGPLSVLNMFDEMHDMVSQLILKWARFGDDNPVDAMADFTRLTLDTIALCAMDMRLNSFYKDELHPFVYAMTDTFVECQIRSVRPAWLSGLMWKANKKFDDDRRLLHDVSAHMIARRRENPSDKKDLINAMINGRDPVTGKQLSDQTIMDNMITFLIAGHETTSALLSYVFGLLLLNRDKYAELQKEVDTVLGDGPMTRDHLNQLPYTKACLREALRLHSPVGAFLLSPVGDAPLILGGKYLIKPGDACVSLLYKIHKDRGIWGEDADEFKPERMLEENFKKLPPNCFKPFGHGARACIGNDFAMQEAIMATAMLMQKLDFNLVDPNWNIKTQQAGAIKPLNVTIYVKPRPHVDVLSLQRDLYHNTDSRSGDQEEDGSAGEKKELLPISVFYGTNTGASQGLADRLASTGRLRGFRCTMKSLNEAVDEFPRTHPVVFISSTHYEGQPPDNATKFMPWLNSQGEGSFDGVNYAVFGCGNTEWQETYQAYPTLIYSTMKKLGANPLAPRGEADAGEGNMLADFDAWQTDHLWPAMAKFYGTALGANVTLPDIPREQSPGSRGDAEAKIEAKVKEIKTLTIDEDRPKYHIEVGLPEGTTYEVGDYLDVYPRNAEQDRERLLQVMEARGHPETLGTVLYDRNELNQPATLKQLETLISNCTNPQDKKTLETAKKTFSEAPSHSRPSVLALLTAYPSISIQPDQLSAMLPPLRPRPYSISSSPLTSPTRCTLTWSLITRHTTSLPGHDDVPVPGLTSHYLAGLQPGDSLSCAVRPGQSRFRPPEDPQTPMIMVCAGAGIAPFVGFVAHRAEQARRGVKLAPALLFVGCRGPKHALYASELEGSGVVDVRYAYSRDDGEGGFRARVQERLWTERDDLVKLWDRGARVYVCGSHAVSLGVKEVVRKMYREVAEERCGAKTEAEVDGWWLDILKERYLVDVF